ncbi:ribosomal protein L1/ribosomal biogenesis protein [Scheffersomyces amazonensis]|uniref:ribosomal protein L1/ribosomal biogenesis protein n=1 Tax=Scheffersomyces amazonensis TaxID=1078765 RepID=UPI00315CB15B
MSSFILGDKSYAQGKKSLKALKNQFSNPTTIYLSINIKITIVRTKDYTPRIIPITHKLDKVENKSVLLITKDPSTPYRDALTAKDSPTEDVFNQIFTLTKLKSIARDPKKVYKLFKEYDIVVADNRVHKFLPTILGGQFYIKNKKVPYMIQMAKPSAESQAQLVRGKKSTKLKDDRCEPKYVKQQMKAIVGNTSYIPSSSGNCLFIRVGSTEWPIEHILHNINDVLQYLIDTKYGPVGGVLKSIDNLGNIHIKTSESISLPLYTPTEITNDDEDDDNSDYDF